jgi:hypothetical protein
MERKQALFCGLLMAATLLPAPGVAQPFETNVLVLALTQGSASAPLPDEPLLQRALQAIRARTGDPGPFEIEAKRVARFSSQQRCGRVAFAVAQPSSHHVFPQLGGELNLCEDGQPPLRHCADNPGTLVPATAHCRNGAQPVDTEEVAAAIQASVSRGGLLPQEARAKFARQAAAAASGVRR